MTKRHQKATCTPWVSICLYRVLHGAERLHLLHLQHDQHIPALTSNSERSRAESSGVERSRAESSGVERSRAESSGVERSRAESSGVERSRAESSCRAVELGPLARFQLVQFWIQCHLLLLKGLGTDLAWNRETTKLLSFGFLPPGCHGPVQIWKEWKENEKQISTMWQSDLKADRAAFTFRNSWH